MSEGARTTEPPTWALGLNLAQGRLGAQVVFATDDFFAAKERLISATAPVWREGEEALRFRVPDERCQECVPQMAKRVRRRDAVGPRPHLEIES